MSQKGNVSSQKRSTLDYPVTLQVWKVLKESHMKANRLVVNVQQTLDPQAL